MADWTEIGPCRLACGDALELLPELEAGSVSCIVTDPPYGIGEAKGKNASRSTLAPATDYGCHDWDDAIPPAQAFAEMRRVSLEQVIFGGNYFTEYLPPSPSWIVWDKDNGASDFADCELAWTSHKRAVRKIKWRWAGMFQENMRSKDERMHPTQKPVGVMEWIIEHYTAKGDLVGDPYMGVGTTGVACVRLGRAFVGVEISPEYFDMACHRIEREVANRQGRLFE